MAEENELDPVSVQSEREEAGIEYTITEEEGGDIEHESHEDDGDECTPLSSNEDPEKQRSYKEYKQLVKDINYQNELLQRIKSQIQDISNKSCPTHSEKKDLEKLHEWLELEMAKLRSLIERAIHLQNFGSRRRYKEFSIVTTFDEDNNMEPFVRKCETIQGQTTKGCSKRNIDRPPCRVSGGDSSELDKSRSCSDQNDRGNKRNELSECEETKLLKEIIEALKECSGPKKSSRPHSKQQSRAPCKKHQSMEDIKSKIDCMQEAISKLKEELSNRESKQSPRSIETKHDTCHSDAPVDPLLLCLNKKGKKEETFQKLKDNYIYLLSEFSKKDDQLRDLQKKLKSSCDKGGKLLGGSDCQNGDTSADQSEIQLLRNRITEMKEEQIEFKCLMREQSLQLDEYRNKYLSAQQKVEEQCALLEKLNMNNKRIEKQINIEIKEIRAKFQEKLNELLRFPRLLENEQIKLAQTCKEKEELEKKLIVVCKELKTLESKARDSNNEQSKAELLKCQQELNHVKKNLDEMQNQRDLFCEQLRTTMEDLDSLRSESAKIIARTKERAEHTKQQLQEQIDCLEKQLAQCRATACLSVSDREAVIKEMQGQLNTLSYSFDAAQKQIKTLRNHIAYMSNENCFPSKC